MMTEGSAYTKIQAAAPDERLVDVLSVPGLSPDTDGAALQKGSTFRIAKHGHVIEFILQRTTTWDDVRIGDMDILMVGVVG